MKSYVKLSRFSLFLSILFLTVLGICLVKTLGNQPFPYVLVITGILVISALLYAPLYVTADEKYVSVKSPLLRHRLRVDRIESVELFQPTLGAYRLLGSGGFMGYWGLFREGDVGRYCAYYGKSSDCFLIRMKTGDKYVLGCEDAPAMVQYISELVTPDMV